MSDQVNTDSASTSLTTLASSGGLLAALHGHGQIDVPKPFSEPILLIEETRVAGTSHVDGLDEVVAELEPGARLAFTREPGNLHDKWAIRVAGPSGEKLGYVPADTNELLARLMDAGKQLYGVFLGSRLFGRYHRIDMEVYLDD